MTSMKPLVRLECGVNSYDWGKTGKHSAAAKYAAATPREGFELDDGKPYAELWMGTHPSLPSKLYGSGETLQDVLQHDTSLATSDILERYGNKLPFLFKVLSIRKALSIQAHPNKQLAKQLHEKDPKNYPGHEDDNHKPEMTIAVTAFDGLCGFRPLEEIVHFLRHVEPLRQLIGASAANSFIAAVGEPSSDKKQALRSLFQTLMNSPVARLKEQAQNLVDKAKCEKDSFAGSGGPSNDGNELADLLIRLSEQFPLDIGLFGLFLLNYVKLQPGEAMFLKADDIHAYLSGDIIECMASSDNVVRAGFTPKFKDVSTLVSMLTYSYAPISEQKMHPVDYPHAKANSVAYSSGSSSLLYDPPIEEFSVIRTNLKQRGAKITFDPIIGPSIVICTEGSGTVATSEQTEQLTEGLVFFLGAGQSAVFEATAETFLTFRAYCELQS